MLIAATTVIAGALALPPPVFVPQEPVAAEASAEQGSADGYQAILDEYDKAMEAYREAYKNAEEEDRRRVSRELRPNPEDYVPRFLALAAEHPGSDIAEKALVWVTKNSRDSSAKEKAARALVRDHLTSEGLADVCSLFEGEYGKGTDTLLKILDQNPHQSVKGTACLSLARNFVHGFEVAQDLMADPDAEGDKVRRYGETQIERVLAAGADELLAGAEEYYSMAMVEYADVDARRGKIGATAERELFAFLNLRIGLVAPDIEAEDIDGVVFKLSDYRGKVVVLDFWGNW